MQIRTEEMHRIAEEGIAAHWKYKEGSKGPAADDQRIAWLRHLVEWQRDMQDPGEFMSTLKVDLYPEEVYTFTPRGKVIVLPRDATPIDFAYAIHSDVGNTCVGAKVNGRIVPLRYTLRNGDIVEIMTQPGHQPSKDWLAFVKTSRARNKIKHVINASERVQGHRDRPEVSGKRSAAARCAAEQDHQGGAGARGRAITATARWRTCTRPSATASSRRARCCRSSRPASVKDEAPEPQRRPPAPAVVAAPGRPRRRRRASSRSSGIDDLLVYRAKCCNPIRGEAIVGYVTRGKGVAVHSKMCPNVQNLMYDVERKIEVEWARAPPRTPSR